MIPILVAKGGVLVVEDLYTLKKDLDKHGTILCFSGVITQDILTTFGDLIELKLEDSFPHMTIARNVFAVFVEIAQNIMSYSSDSKIIEDDTRGGSGIIVIGYDTEKKKFFVKSGNKVTVENQERISQKIDQIKNLSHEELREVYKQARKSGKDSHHRGGGLGFIEMQRKCSEPLDYRFDKVGEDSVFFNLVATI